MIVAKLSKDLHSAPARLGSRRVFQNSRVEASGNAGTVQFCGAPAVATVEARALFRRRAGRTVAKSQVRQCHHV